MICKKCGAYNPDHANFCKVCAANLKDQTDTDDAAKSAEAEETFDKEFRPRRGNVKAPDFSAARHGGSFNAAPKAQAPAAKELEDEEEDEFEEEAEEVKPAAKKPVFAHPAAPAPKRRVVDEEYDGDDDEYEDDYDEDEEEEEVKPAPKKSFFSRMTAPSKKRAIPEDDKDEEDDEDEEEEYEEEDEDDAEKLESEPKTSRFARPAFKKRPVEDEEDEDEDDEDEDQDEEEEYEEEEEDKTDDEDDGYEEYEPTPPRRKNTRSRSKGSDGGSKIVAILIICLLAVLLIIAGIIVVGNLNSKLKANLPAFLQFNCAGKATTEKEPPSQKPAVTTPEDVETTVDPADAPVTGTPVDYLATKMEEGVDDNGNPCIFVEVKVRPHDVLTILFPVREDYVVSNDSDADAAWKLTIYKQDLYPNTIATEPTMSITPQIMVTHADGSSDYLNVDSFEITFPTVQLELSEPAPMENLANGIMAAEDGTLFIKGKVDDHYVSILVNGQPVYNKYKEGNFDYTYVMTGDEPETVTIEASKPDYISTSFSFTVNPYVFIPDPMVLNVESDFNKLKADKNQKVTVTGTTVPGATLTATPASEYMTSVVCGAPNVDAEGHFSFEVTFDKSYYGIASIVLHAKKEGYEEGETTCIVSRMYADQKAAVSGFSKTKSYHEVYKYYKFEEILANPTDSGLYRFSGKITAVDAETGIVTMQVESAKGQTATIYVLNASEKWEPDKHVGDKYFLYCTLNGLYTDGASVYATVWFIKKTK